MVPLRSSRRRLAGFSVLGAWLAGVLILPALHLAFHDVPHDHVGSAIHFRAAAGTDASRHVHPHRAEDAAALRRASGKTVTAPLSAGLEIQAPTLLETHEADGLGHFGSSPGEGAPSSTALAASRFSSPNCDSLPGRFFEFFLEGKRAPRPPPIA